MDGPGTQIPRREALVDQLSAFLGREFCPERDNLLERLDTVTLPELLHRLEAALGPAPRLYQMRLHEFGDLETLASAWEPASTTSARAQARLPNLPAVEAWSERWRAALEDQWQHYVEELRQWDPDLAYDATSLDRIVRGAGGSGGAPSRILVQGYRDSLVGFLIARSRMTPRYMGARLEGFITDCYVHPEYRRAKVATRLHDAAVAFFREAKITSVALMVIAGNERAHRFWKSQGYRTHLHELRLKVT